MPLLTVKAIEGVFTPPQKREIIHKLTETLVSIKGEALRPYTQVIIEEVKSGDWGVGGNVMTTAAVKDLGSRQDKDA